MNKKYRKVISLIPLLAISAYVFVGQVYAEPYGWSPSVDNSWQGPPKCTDEKPDKAPILLQPNHPALPKKPANAGEVVLYWHKVPGATGYNIYYGLSPKNYIYTAPDIGDTNNFTIRYLANKVYYFAVQAKKGCAAGVLSQEWAARPGKGGYISGAAAGFTAVRKTSPSVAQKPGAPLAYVPNKEVKGLTVEATQPPAKTYQQQQTQTPQRVYVTPTPKPKGFWQMLLSFFGLGK